MSRFATGVTVATAGSGERIHGMTVNSFTSVSLSPPLVLWCAVEGCRTLKLIQEGGAYAINILSQEQEGLSRHFSSPSTSEGDRFQGLAWRPGPRTGCPLLEGALATLECRLVQDLEAGDHRILLARVEALTLAGEGSPLIYFGSRYRALEPLAPTGQGPGGR